MTTDTQADEAGKGGAKKAPFAAGGRGTGRIFSEMHAPALPPPGVSLRTISAKQAARRFSETLTDAVRDPVIVTRHGRPCAVIMAVGRFELHEALVRQHSYALAAERLHGAIEASAQGRLKTSAQLRLEARRLGQFADRRRK